MLSNMSLEETLTGLPKLIDISEMSEIPIVINKKYINKKNLNAVYMDEHVDDIEKLIIKTNISNIINSIEECENLIETKQMVNALKNMIILHGKIIKNMPVFIKNIECSLKNYKLKYDSIVIYKMLFNLKENKIKENYHFRVINITVKKYPPLTIEERTILEKKIKYTRFSYQAKKKRNPFKVGQIVGAKDKENKWWLSRILHVHNDEERSGYWYYVRFEGWGPIHDEWIYSETFRVNWFNARKHFLKK